jgi:hypothetical protein
MKSFDAFWSELEDELKEFAEYSWKSHTAAAVADGEEFLRNTKVDLERWTKLLAKGDLTTNDFEWLVAGKKEVAELVALKRSGLAKVALDRFVNGLIDTIVSAAFKQFV